MEKTKKKDFVELEFTAKIRESGAIFDTNRKEDAKKIEMEHENLKPLRICIGEGMVVKGFDRELENKEVGKEYEIDVSPEESFGMRNSKLIRTIPMKVFLERKINPARGLMLNMDGMLARIASVSGGRVTVDFNNPLSGKVIRYEFIIKRIIDGDKEKILSLARFLCNEEAKVRVEGKKAEIELNQKKNFGFLKKKVKDMLGIELEAKEKKGENEPDKKTPGVS